MKIQKRYLILLGSMLNECKGLNLKDARLRDSFGKQVSVPLNTFYGERTKIFQEFCDKDEKTGKPVIPEGDSGKTQYRFSMENKDKMTAELEILLGEEIELTPPEDIKRIIEGTEYKPQVGETEVIDELLGLL